MKTIAAVAVFAAIATMHAEPQAPAYITALREQIGNGAPAEKPPEAEKPAIAEEKPAEVEKPVIQAPNVEETEKPVMQAPKAESEEKPAVPDAKPAEGTKKKPKKALTGRDAKITSETMSYDRKEGILFFDRKVYVDDEQYQMHADRVYVFLSGTNDVKRLVALGNVALTNEFRSATCEKAVYVKATSKVVMYAPEGGVATLKDESEKGGTITGSKITFWLDSEQVEVQNSDITVPGGSFKADDAKKLLGK